jgi:hypothetical protein
MADVVEGFGVIRRGAKVHRHLTVAAVSSREARGDGGMDLSSIIQQGGRGCETAAWSGSRGEGFLLGVLRDGGGVGQRWGRRLMDLGF